MKKAILLSVSILFSFSVFGQSSRGIRSVSSAREYLGENTYVLLDSNWIHFDPKLFPQSATRFFFISYEYQGQTINKKLNSDGQDLIIIRRELFKVDGQPIPDTLASNFLLFYYNAERQISEQITSLKLSLQDNEHYVNEVAQIISQPAFEEKSDDEIIRALANLWRLKYGYVDDKSLRSLLNQARK